MKCIDLYYYNNEPNFGDRLIEDICRDIFNTNINLSEPFDCEAALIGSVLEIFMQKKIGLEKYSKFFKKSVKTWGVGFIKEAKYTESKDNFTRNMEFFAVRGELTKKRLEKIFNKKLDVPNVPLGDPGLLASYLIDYEKIEKKYDLGIVPHYIEADLQVYEEIRKNIPNSVIIDVQDMPLRVLEKIAQCKAVISSAMHGLIASDSLHIPNLRVYASDRIVGGDYKFNDYYSAFGMKEHNKIDLRTHNFTVEDVQNIHKNYKTDYAKIEKVKENLIKSFPYKNEKYTFPLSLNYIQNIRFLCALLENDENICVPESFRMTMEYLNKFFGYKVRYSKEKPLKLKFIEFDHQTPFIKYGSVQKPLVFPKKMIEYCQKTTPKVFDYTFTGIKTKTRVNTINKWLKHFFDIEIDLDEREKFAFDKSKIEFTENGRIFPRKAWDEEYFKTLMQSKFVLCPNGDFVWTYRFFEAVMCNAIPVIEDDCGIYQGYKYYTMKDKPSDIKYDSAIAAHNYKKLVETLTFVH